MVTIGSCTGLADLPEDYFEVRYEVLRRPLGSPHGSERLTDDSTALHVWATAEGRTVSVGRAAVISGGGEAHDPVGSHCPPFAPLCVAEPTDRDDMGNLLVNTRPAIQIRQMGTLEEFRGMGLAAQVLAHLETEAAAIWNWRTAWLQARTGAIGFYISCGWSAYGREYHVDKVGAHRSMWKPRISPSTP